MQDPITGAPGTPPDTAPAPSPASEPFAGANPPSSSASPTADSPDQAPRSLAGEARRKLTGTLDSQKGAAADFVQQLARTVEQSGQQFGGKQDWIASAVGRGAAELDALAGSLRDRDVGELIGEVGQFARRQPALFTGAALAAGFAVARLGKVVAGDLSRADLPTVPAIGQPTGSQVGHPTGSEPSQPTATEVGQPTGPEVDHGQH